MMICQYDIRVAPRSAKKQRQRISRVRLTGWRVHGKHAWIPFGVRTPGPLIGWLSPRRNSVGAWEIKSELDKEWVSRFIAASRQGGVVTSPTLIYPDPPAVISPVMAHRNRSTAELCRRALDRYSRTLRPAITIPPEPSDFFNRVKAGSRDFPVFEIDNGMWLKAVYRRRVWSGLYWDVLVERYIGDLSDLEVVRWSNAGDPLKAREAWAGARHRVSWAWESSLSALRYGLWCYDVEVDPLNQFKRYAGGKVTVSTLEHALAFARRATRDLWRLDNSRASAWNQI